MLTQSQLILKGARLDSADRGSYLIPRRRLFMRSLLQPFHLVSFHNLCKTLFLTLHPAFPLGVKPPHPDKSLCLQRSF